MAFESLVEIGDIGPVVLVVVNLHRLRVNVRLERVERVRERRQIVSHRTGLLSGRLWTGVLSLFRCSENTESFLHATFLSERHPLPETPHLTCMPLLAGKENPMAAITARTKKNEVIALERKTIDDLRGRLRGTILLPGDPGYNEVRSLWNGMVDRRPALIARCTNVADVIAAVTFGREKNLVIAIKGGGHNVTGNA